MTEATESRDWALPRITVIVPVRNEAAHIRGTLEQVLRQEYDPAAFEVLVVDGRSTDATPEIVRGLQAAYPNLQLLDNPRRLSSAARNIGVRHARGELIAIIDGHCEIVNPHYLRDLADAFDRSGADCLGRPQPLDVTGASPLQEAIAQARSSWLGHHPASFIYADEEQIVPPESVAVAYRRSVFERVGLFDEAFDACEDVEFNHRVARAGLTCFFTPRIAVRYHPRGTLGGLFRQLARYGRGRVRLLRKHSSSFSASSFVPAAFVAGLIVGLPLAWLSPWLGLVYAVCLGIYGLAVLAATCAIALRPGNLRLLPYLPLVFLTVHLGSGTGVLTEPAGTHRPGNRRPVRCAAPDRSGGCLARSPLPLRPRIAPHAYRSTPGRAPGLHKGLPTIPLRRPTATHDYPGTHLAHRHRTSRAGSGAGPPPSCRRG
jgi:succinoglycan biosynthesis protein ExoA